MGMTFGVPSDPCRKEIGFRQRGFLLDADLKVALS